MLDRDNFQSLEDINLGFAPVGIYLSIPRGH